MLQEPPGSIHRKGCDYVGLVTAKDLLAVLWPDPESRPSLRWLRERQKEGTAPGIRVGGRVFFDPSEALAAMEGGDAGDPALSSGPVDASRLLAAIWPLETSRPSLRWLIPIRINKLTFKGGWVEIGNGSAKAQTVAARGGG